MLHALQATLQEQPQHLDGLMPNLEAKVPVFMSPRDMVAQLYPRIPFLPPLTTLESLYTYIYP
jgi:hypothetical protein